MLVAALLLGADTARATPAGALTAGGNHTCALDLYGRVRCWGANGDGELGNGATQHSSVPVAVLGLPTGITAVDAGSRHTCAIAPGGAPLCWGYNQHGQLGNGSSASSSVPVAVSGLASGVARVGAGGSHTCALTSGGGVLCWGLNSSGQLGSPVPLLSNVPVPVTGLASGVAAIATGGFHTCALTTGGAVLCWGFNEDGQLGDGSNGDSVVPVAVSGLESGVAAIAAGAYHACALTTTGAIRCWGSNLSGQLGDGSTTSSNLPVGVSGFASGAAAVAAGDHHSCAITTTGGVRCWGLNGAGQLGDGSNTSSNLPLNVSGMTTGSAAVAAGSFHSCALSGGGGIECWGFNAYGQLGDASTQNSSVPVPIYGNAEVPSLGLAGLAVLVVSLAAAGAWARKRTLGMCAPVV